MPGSTDDDPESRVAWRTPDPRAAELPEYAAEYGPALHGYVDVNWGTGHGARMAVYEAYRAKTSRRRPP